MKLAQRPRPSSQQSQLQPCSKASRSLAQWLALLRHTLVTRQCTDLLSDWKPIKQGMLFILVPRLVNHRASAACSPVGPIHKLRPFDGLGWDVTGSQPEGPLKSVAS